MLDTSGSMFGELLYNAAMTSAVLYYIMKKDNISIVFFISFGFNRF